MQPASSQSIGHVTLVVRDYDEAISYYVEILNFTVVEDTVLSESKRWVLVAPPGSTGTNLLLAKAATPRQLERVGYQTGGRVAFFLRTDNFARDYSAMKARGVRFIEEPRNEPYATVVIFEDLYGNRWDFLEMKPRKAP
jgi:catechol 2,3-dioxygenase-like lactoylglutathione lyase family enzyme